MRIYLMRHGEAGFNARNDDERELTEPGRAKIRRQIEARRDELARVGCWRSSPIRRAAQTAQLAQELLGRRGAIDTVGWLVHESKPRQAIEALAQVNAASVLLFSHQPLASRFVELLCGLDDGAIAMDTASLIALDADPVAAGLGRIIWQDR